MNLAHRCFEPKHPEPGTKISKPLTYHKTLIIKQVKKLTLPILNLLPPASSNFVTLVEPGFWRYFEETLYCQYPSDSPSR